MGSLNSFDLLRRILLGGGDFIGTREEMEFYIEQAPEKFPEIKKRFKQGELVNYWDADAGEMRSGRYQYDGIGKRSGYLVIVDAGRTVYVLNRNVEKNG